MWLFSGIGLIAAVSSTSAWYLFDMPHILVVPYLIAAFALLAAISGLIATRKLKSSAKKATATEIAVTPGFEETMLREDISMLKAYSTLTNNFLAFRRL